MCHFADHAKEHARPQSVGVQRNPAARRYPGHPAIIDERGTLTFAELDARTNARVRALRGAGIVEGDRIAILRPSTDADGVERCRGQAVELRGHLRLSPDVGVQLGRKAWQ